MPTRAEIDARKAVIAAVKNGHNTFAGAFNQGASALTPIATDFQPLILKLNAAAVAHNNSVPLITAAELFWNSAVPSDLAPGETPDGTRAATITDPQGRVWSLGIPAGNGEFVVMRDGVAPDNGGTALDFFKWRGFVFKCRPPNDWFVWYDRIPTVGDFVPIYKEPAWDEYFSGTPHVNMSPHGTRGQAVTDAYGAVWTIVNGNTIRDGVGTGGTGVVEYTLLNYTVVVKVTDGTYWEWSGSGFISMGATDPLLVDNGTVDYGPVDDGMRANMTEAQLAADTTNLIYYGATNQASCISQWGLNLTTHDGLRRWKPWPSRGGIEVLRAPGGISLGPNMVVYNRDFAPRDSAWLHQPVMIDPDFRGGMHEQGIKLSGLHANGAESGMTLSIRLWLRKPYHCLPNHMRVAIYVYDRSSGNGFGEIIDSNGYLKIGDITGLSLYCEGNGFNVDGTAQPNGKYKIKMEGRTILNVTNRVMRYLPGDKFARGTLELYHGGQGCPFPLHYSSTNPLGEAIHAELGPQVVASIDPGFMRAA